MFTKRFSSAVLPLLFLAVSSSFAQSRNERALPPHDGAPSAEPVCTQAPREDALPSLCAPPTSLADDSLTPNNSLSVPVQLVVPAGTPMRVAIEQRVRISHPGEVVRGKLVDAVYAFDTPVIPAGSLVTGRVTNIARVSGLKRSLAYANGDLSPFRKYEITFDQVALPDSKVLPIKTTVSPGVAEIVHLVSNAGKEDQKGATGRAVAQAKQEARGKIQEGQAQAHQAWQKLAAPGRLHRTKEYLLAQSPHRRQYLEQGTRFVADLDAPLDFGAAPRTAQQLAALGSEPAPDTTLKARLVAEVSSATATKGTQVSALLTEPLYSPTHQLILPVNSRLIGEVTQAKAARKLHRNGELRLMFVRIEEPQEASAALAQAHQLEAEGNSQAGSATDTQAPSQAMIGNVQGLEVDRRANLKLDEEGGAHTTTSRTRYLSTGLAVLLAAAASHPEGDADAGRGATDAAGDPGVRTAAGGSGFRLTRALLSLVARSTPVSAALGAHPGSATREPPSENGRASPD